MCRLTEIYGEAGNEHSISGTSLVSFHLQMCWKLPQLPLQEAAYHHGSPQHVTRERVLVLFLHEIKYTVNIL